MRHAPNMWSLRDLAQHVATGRRASRDGVNYYPARPEGFFSFGHRIAIAWLVFTGRADALIWPEGPVEKIP